jgi:hypothetical protein
MMLLLTLLKSKQRSHAVAGAFTDVWVGFLNQKSKLLGQSRWLCCSRTWLAGSSTSSCVSAWYVPHPACIVSDILYSLVPPNQGDPAEILASPIYQPVGQIFYNSLGRSGGLFYTVSALIIVQFVCFTAMVSPKQLSFCLRSYFALVRRYHFSSGFPLCASKDLRNLSLVAFVWPYLKRFTPPIFCSGLNVCWSL